MTKSGAEKKRVRRSSALQNGGSRDPNNDTPPRKQVKEKDLFQLFSEKVRDHKELESRWGVLQETRVEYFRGKDFVSFLGKHPEVKEVLESDKSLGPEDIANVLLGRSLLVRCDRVVKIVRPGKKKLSTWPAHLEIHPDQQFSDNDAFFAWTFVKRRPLWQTILSFVWPVVTLAICLFPVFPHQCKLLVLYTCAGLLLLIFSVLSVRGLIFGTVWILLGRRLWIFPNILAEETTLSELFQFWPKKDEEERPKWTSRLFYAVVAAVFILVLRHHAPDEAARARYQRRVSNIIDDVLEWSPKLALSGFMDQESVVNATETHSAAKEEQVAPPKDEQVAQPKEDHEVEEPMDREEV